MCSALQKTLNLRLVLLLSAVLNVYLFSIAPAFSSSYGHGCDSPLLGTESMCAQVVSPSGYRYDSPTMGNPYMGGSGQHSGRFPSARSTTYLPSNYPSNPYVQPYAPNPTNQYNAGANQDGASTVSGSLPTFYPGTPQTTAPFPQYQPRRYDPYSGGGGMQYQTSSTSYNSYRPRFNRLSPAELHEKTIWSAATSDEENMLARIQQQQLSTGPDDPATLQYMMDTANYFAQEQKPNLAEPLLKEVIATIQTHPNAAGNYGLLSSAQSKLSQLQSEDTRVASTPVIDPSTVYVAKPYNPITYGSSYGNGGYGYGYGGYGYGGHHYGHSYGHSFHVHYSSHSSGGGHAHFR